MAKKKMITIALEEYVSLLNGAGVDNWEGIEYTYENLEESLLTEDSFKDDERLV